MTPSAHSHTDGPRRALAVVGMGPRGTSVVERLVAASTLPTWQGSVDLHVIDPQVGLGGAVWRADQGDVLLMNTATQQTTNYPDESVTPQLPVLHTDTLADHLAADGFAPADIAPRARYGTYLAHVLEQAEADADPQRLRIHRHRATAVDVTGEPDGTQLVHLEDGRRLAVDAVALCLGHLATALGPRSLQYAEAATAHGLLHIGPANPLDVDYGSLLGRRRVAVQGMGLNFYDAIGGLVTAAGGRFEEAPDAPSGLRYLPGGGEPQLVVGSRSGMVYRPKPDLRPDLPAPYEPTVLTSERVLSLAVRPSGVDHERDVMPLMYAELRTALRAHGFEALAEGDALERILFPLGRRSAGVDDAHRRTRDVLRRSLVAATMPDPAWVLIFRVLTALRIQVNRLQDLGAYTTESLRRDIDGHLRNAFASWASGPPVIRARQVLALEEAGLVRFTGPGQRLAIEDGAFVVRTAVDPEEYRCDGLLEAHLPGVDLVAYTSRLMTAWRDRGEVQRDEWASRGAGTRIPTGSIAVDALYAPVAADGRVFSRRYLLGVPVSTAQPGSAISAEPGTGAQLLRHAETVAIRLAQHAGALSDPTGSAGPRAAAD
ncbi:FAD/NAD(P)-binding protein [Brachybacterium sp. EF45031]|uniref:FAD/NAD(P)-binding protein n=1 Tax=Brachybacterium sillae TaxID=2810536 RepID=UPI00217ED89C|nr:FAD/NAD(P)-binding protein [Brachybacterium sillae]MCS6712435.1 FAD/NAD(P)-binding protein [Brachybacterium sillae]